MTDERKALEVRALEREIEILRQYGGRDVKALNRIAKVKGKILKLKAKGAK